MPLLAIITPQIAHTAIVTKCAGLALSAAVSRQYLVGRPSKMHHTLHRNPHRWWHLCRGCGTSRVPQCLPLLRVLASHSQAPAKQPSFGVELVSQRAPRTRTHLPASPRSMRRARPPPGPYNTPRDGSHGPGTRVRSSKQQRWEGSPDDRHRLFGCKECDLFVQYKCCSAELPTVVCSFCGHIRETPTKPPVKRRLAASALFTPECALQLSSPELASHPPPFCPA